IHIKTDGSISSANGTNVVVRGHDVVLEAAGGAIGGDPNGGDGSLHTDIDGDLTARAKVIDLVNHGDLSIQRVTGTEALRLRVLGNLAASTQFGVAVDSGEDAVARHQRGAGLHPPQVAQVQRQATQVPVAVLPQVGGLGDVEQPADVDVAEAQRAGQAQRAGAISRQGATN
ncbi:hypothetical protein, partial [Caulobacter sp.]|uniref:hypothetical protein n=1 Tax=Caulobacter sp. TaxID=78 RepID=UPI001AFDC1AC